MAQEEAEVMVEMVVDMQAVMDEIVNALSKVAVVDTTQDLSSHRLHFSFQASKNCDHRRITYSSFGSVPHHQ